MEPASRVAVSICGAVQGVFFRAETARKAQALGLKGWVRNVRDGSVECVFEGSRNRVEEVLEWCKHGPAGAQVDSVEVTWEKPAGENGFVIRYS